MNVYQCFFTRHVGEVPDFLVFEAKDDARAFIRADVHLDDHPNYISVEIFEDDRRVGRLERPASTAPRETGGGPH
jgi:hypothetical protein